MISFWSFLKEIANICIHAKGHPFQELTKTEGLALACGSHRMPLPVRLDCVDPWGWEAPPTGAQNHRTEFFFVCFVVRIIFSSLLSYRAQFTPNNESTLKSAEPKHWPEQTEMTFTLPTGRMETNAAVCRRRSKDNRWIVDLMGWGAGGGWRGCQSGLWLWSSNHTTLIFSTLWTTQKESILKRFAKWPQLCKWPKMLAGSKKDPACVFCQL